MPKKKKKQTTRRKKINDNQKKRLLTYYAVVAGLVIVYHFFSGQSWFQNGIQPVFYGYASLSSDLLNILGQETVAIGKDIRSAAFSLTIKNGCDGISPMLLYAMAILAFPIKMKFKWQGALLGLLVLFLLNVTRIITLYFIGKVSSAEFFEFMHVDVWSVAYLVAAVFLWLVWMHWALVTKKAAMAVSPIRN